MLVPGYFGLRLGQTPQRSCWGENQHNACPAFHVRTQQLPFSSLSAASLHHHEAKSTPGSKGIHQPQSTRKRVSSRLPWGLDVANQKHNYHWREEREERKDFSHSWTKSRSQLHQKLLRGISSQEAHILFKSILGKKLYADFLSQT